MTTMVIQKIIDIVGSCILKLYRRLGIEYDNSLSMGVVLGSMKG